VPSVCTRVVTTPVAGVATQVPRVDRRPRVAAAAAQALGRHGESIEHHFEDGDSTGRCGDGGAMEAAQNDGTHR
jgi:hypothetical protein